MPCIGYRDRGPPEDDAWPLEVGPDPLAGARTLAWAAPARNSSEVSREIRARFGLVGVGYIERVIAMETATASSVTRVVCMVRCSE